MYRKGIDELQKGIAVTIAGQGLCFLCLIQPFVIMKYLLLVCYTLPEQQKYTTVDDCLKKANLLT